MFAKKDTMTDALDSFWGNGKTTIPAPIVDNTPRDIVPPTSVGNIGAADTMGGRRYDAVQDNIDRATYGYDPYARASAQQAPYQGIDKGSLLRDVFEGKRKGRFNVSIESFQTSPLTGKERKVTENIDISPNELRGYGSRLISTEDTDIAEPMHTYRPQVMAPQVMAPQMMSYQQPAPQQQSMPSLFGVDALINKEVAFNRSIKRETSNPYDIFGMDEFVKNDMAKQKQALSGMPGLGSIGMNTMGPSFMDTGSSSMMNDFASGMNYSGGMSQIDSKERFDMMRQKRKSEFDMAQERATLRSNLADAASLRRGMFEEADYVKSRRQRGEFESGLPVTQGVTDMIFGGKTKVNKPAYTRTYTNDKGKKVTEKVAAQEGVIERYGGVLGAAKETYGVAKPIVKDAYGVSKAAYGKAKPIFKDTYAASKPIVKEAYVKVDKFGKNVFDKSKPVAIQVAKNTKRFFGQYDDDIISPASNAKFTTTKPIEKYDVEGIINSTGMEMEKPSILSTIKNKIFKPKDEFKPDTDLGTAIKNAQDDIKKGL